MLIGIDASRANRLHKSGTEWYSYYLIRALSTLDSENQYILYTDVPLTDGLADLTEQAMPNEKNLRVDKEGKQIIKSPHNNFQAKVLKWPWKFFWTQGRLSLEMIFHRPDVLFIPAHALPIIHPRKSVVTIHDIGFFRDAALYEQNRLGAVSRRPRGFLNFVVRVLSGGKYGANSLDYLQWSTRFSLKKALHIITISHFTKSELLYAYNTSSEKISVIYNGYSSALYRPLPDDEHSQHILSRYGITKPYFFYVGRLEKKKNTAALIEAFALLKNTKDPTFNHKLVLVGDASFGFDEIKYTITAYQLTSEVIITGWVDENDLPYIFAQAEAFIFPSNYEGFGIPLLQAMATRTAITASRAASIPEIVGDAALLFDPKNSADMAKALETVLCDESVREDLIKKGSERVKNFSWQKAAQETLEVFKNLNT